MSTDGRLTDLLACPRCDKTPLSNCDEQYYCSACKIAFPLVGDIPWLFADVDASLGEWRNRLHFFLQQLSSESQRMQAELTAGNVGSLTGPPLLAGVLNGGNWRAGSIFLALMMGVGLLLTLAVWWLCRRERRAPVVAEPAEL